MLAKRPKLIDRLSSLPNEVIDIILSRLPFEDAVRTSALSTQWRTHWRRLDRLTLAWDFADNILDRLEDEVKASTFTGIVSNILLSLTGLVRSFFLHIPDFGNAPEPAAIDLWILDVSRRGVQTLSVWYRSGNGKKCPFSVFQCTELKHLILQNVELSLPFHNFRNLSSLRSISLVGVKMSGDMLTNIIQSCPKLELLSLKCFSYVDFILVNTEAAKSLTKFQPMVAFFHAVPKIKGFVVTSVVLELWASQALPERLPALLENLQIFNIKGLDMHSKRQVNSMVCLIKSSPNLQNMRIELCLPQNKSHESMNFLQSEVSNAKSLWSLRTIWLKGLMGDEPDFVFIQLVLASCPMLKSVYLTSSRYIIGTDDAIDMMCKIMDFPRASSQARISLFN